MENSSEQDQDSSADKASHVRRDEKPRTWFRSDRFLQMSHQWYFMTREGPDVGPFVSREETEAAERRFIDCMNKGVLFERAVAVAKDGDWALVMYQ